MVTYSDIIFYMIWCMFSNFIDIDPSWRYWVEVRKWLKANTLDVNKHQGVDILKRLQSFNFPLSVDLSMLNVWLTKNELNLIAEISIASSGPTWGKLDMTHGFPLYFVHTIFLLFLITWSRWQATDGICLDLAICFDSSSHRSAYFRAMVSIFLARHLQLTCQLGMSVKQTLVLIVFILPCFHRRNWLWKIWCNFEIISFSNYHNVAHIVLHYQDLSFFFSCEGFRCTGMKCLTDFWC